MNQILRVMMVLGVVACMAAGCTASTQAVADAGESADASDVGAGSDATSGSDAVSDVLSGSDSADTNDVADASLDATDAADTAAPSDASDAADAADSSDAADAVDSADAGTPTCYSNGDCAPTEFCKSDPQGCNGVCTPLHKPGEKCGIDGILCVPGSVCTNGATCHVQVEAKVGEKCQYDFCGAGLYCKGFQSAKVCEAKGDVGIKCQSDQQCLDGLMCNPSYTCAPPFADGASCVTVGNKAQCTSGSICAQTVDLAGASTQTCLATKASGDACTSHSQCTGTGQFCKGLSQASGSSGVCAALPAAGSACLDATAAWGGVAVCLAPAFCANKVCTAPGSVGSACDANTPCAAGLKCFSKAGISTCLTPAQTCQ